MHCLTTGPCFGRSLGISPCRTQFFKRESLTLCCRADERIMTNSKSVTCSQKSHECNITLAGEHHSGSYWCDCSGERGEAVNITVTGMCVSLSPVGSPTTLFTIYNTALLINDHYGQCDPVLHLALTSFINLRCGSIV